MTAPLSVGRLTQIGAARRVRRGGQEGVVRWLGWAGEPGEAGLAIAGLDLDALPWCGAMIISPVRKAIPTGRGG